MKKRLFLTLLVALTCMANGWAQKLDPRYAPGAVPEENGRVVFTHRIEAPLPAGELYNVALEWANIQYKPDEEMPNHKIIAENPEACEVTAGGEEFIVFSSKAWSLDRTRVYYKINLAAQEGVLTARIFNIRYWYEEDRNGGFKYTAEEWITDEKGLNKKKNKLARMSGKFRAKTIDHVQQLFEDLELYISRKVMKKTPQN